MRGAALLLALALTLPAWGQQYRFPTSNADYGSYYYTAYFDHGGDTDWNCGNNSYSGHQGNDFGGGSWSGMDAGRDIVAAANGTVVYTHDGEDDECSTGDCGGGGGYGNYVKLQHASGSSTYYAHMKTWSVAVSKGQQVSCGDLLGLMGSSGNSTGPHLHFEVRDAANNRIDPFEGNCSSTPSSLWVNQGPYEGLPTLDCDGPLPECQPVQTLTCGDSVGTGNDGAGSQQQTSYYGCTEWAYTGPEMAYTFVTDLDEPVTVDLTGNTADLDLYVLASTACDGSDCLGASDSSDDADEQVIFDAAAGVEYVVVVDGYEGAISPFTLAVTCAGGLPGDDDTGDDDDTVGDDDSVADDDSGDDDQAGDDDIDDHKDKLDGGMDAGACSCGHQNHTTPATGPGVLALLGGMLFLVRAATRR